MIIEKNSLLGLKDNNKKKNLLIITAIYPFGEADSFVQKEIEVLSGEFEIDVLPQDKFSGSSEINSDKKTHLFKYYKGVCGREDSNRLLPALAYAIFTPFFSIRLFVLFFKELFTSVPQTPGRVIRCVLLDGKSLFRVSLRLSQLLATTARLVIINYKTKEFNFKNYDLVYSYWANDLALYLSIRHPSISLISRFHGYDLYESRRKSGYFPYRKHFLSIIKLALFVCDQGLNYLCELYGSRYKSKFLRNYLGARNPSRKIIEFVPENYLKVVTVSNFSKVKQLNKLVEAIKHCDFKVEWHHIGGAGAEEFRYLTSSLIDSKHNLVYHGFVRNELLIDVIISTKADLFINCSESEGLPVSLLECMSVGLPILAPRVGGISEAVFSDINGFMLNSNFSVGELQLKIERFYYTKSEKRMKMSNKSLMLWRKLFDESVCVRQLMDIFVSIGK